MKWGLLVRVATSEAVSLIRRFHVSLHFPLGASVTTKPTRKPTSRDNARAAAAGAGSLRVSDFEVESQIDVTGGLTTSDSPILQRTLVQHDHDVHRGDAQSFESVSDALVQIALSGR